MKLSAAVVVELAQLKAQIAALQKQEKEIVEDVKKQMKKEKLSEFVPDDCPYKFLYSEFPRASVSWKDEWERIAKKFYGHGWKKKEKKLIEENKVPSSTLNVEINELYDPKAA